MMVSGNLNKVVAQPQGKYDAALYTKAVQLAQSSLIIDGHVDAPYRFKNKMEDISKSTSANFDYPKAKKGGLDAPFMSIYIPASFQQTPGASKQVAEDLIAMMDSVVAKNPDKFAHAATPTDLKSNFSKGLISFLYGMENGSPIEADLQEVAYFFDKGVRYITLTHSKRNLICDSSYDEDRSWGGLSPFGRSLIVEMNRIGMMIDISHVSDSTFYQVLALSKAPVICSHSSLRHFTPDWERNVSDEMLKRLAKNGGVIQVNFGSTFLTAAANGHSLKRQAFRQSIIHEKESTGRDNEGLEAAMQRFKEENPYPFAKVEDVVAHIDRAVQIAGIDHVGLGSDFDGVGDSLPTGLKSVADFPNLVYHLLKKGYSDQDVRKILGQNVMRVWRDVAAFAAQQDLPQ